LFNIYKKPRRFPGTDPGIFDTYLSILYKKTSNPKDIEVRSVITNKAPYPFGCDAVVFGPEPCDEQDLNYGIATCYLHQFRML